MAAGPPLCVWWNSRLWVMIPSCFPCHTGLSPSFHPDGSALVGEDCGFLQRRASFDHLFFLQFISSVFIPFEWRFGCFSWWFILLCPQIDLWTHTGYLLGLWCQLWQFTLFLFLFFNRLSSFLSSFRLRAKWSGKYRVPINHLVHVHSLPYY